LLFRSQTAQSYINALQTLAQKLRDDLSDENPTLAELALADTTHTLPRLPAVENTSLALTAASRPFRAQRLR
jgi:hypothetical protein